MTNIPQLNRESVRKTYDNQSPAFKRFLLQLAYSMNPLSEENLTKIAKNDFKVPLRDFQKLLTDWVEDGYTIKIRNIWFVSNSFRYKLHPVLHSILLLELAGMNDAELQAFDDVDRRFNEYFYNNMDRIRMVILKYLRYGIVDLENRKFNFNNENPLIDLAESWLDFEEFLPLIPLLPSEVRARIVDNEVVNAVYYFYACSVKRLSFIDKANDSKQDKQAFWDNTILPCLFYKGDLEGISSLPASISPARLFAQGLYMQYKDRLAEAIKFYEAGIQGMAGTSLPSNTFYRYAYVAALMKEGSQRSMKKLAALERKREVQDMYAPDNYLLRMMLKLSTSFDIDSIKRMYQIEHESPTPLHYILERVVLSHFNIRQLSREEKTRILELINEHTIKPLALEVANSIDTFESIKESLINDMGGMALLPEYEHKELWEKAIDLVLGQDENKPAVAKVKGSRVIYLIGTYGSVTPRMQTSKDGVKWSSGRNIALKSFLHGINEMTEFDRQIAATVETRRESYYRGYRESYVLGGAKTLKLLAGYPLLFMESNPNVHFEISLERPYISLERVNDGFSLKSNIDSEDLTHETMFHYDGATRINVVELTARQRAILTMLKQVEFFPAKAEKKLKSLIERIGSDITIHSDIQGSAENLMQIKSESIVTVQLLPAGDSFKAKFFIKPLGDNPPYCKPGEGLQSVVGKKDGVSVQAIRDFLLERRHFDIVTSQLSEFEFESEDEIYMEGPTDCLALLEVLNSMGNDIVRIEWPEGARLGVKSRVSTGNFSISVYRKNNWFEMVGELSYGEGQTIALAELMKKINEQNQPRFINIGQNEYLALSEDLRRVLRSMNTFTADKSGALRVSSFSVPSLSGLSKLGIAFTGDDAYRSLVKKVADADLKEYPVPATLQAELRPYQEEGYRWMARLDDWGAGACLADDMGLGKTVQTIAMILHKASKGPVIVVAPASVVSNWKSELDRFAPSLKSHVLNLESDRRAIINAATDNDVILTTYGVLVTECDTIAGKEWGMVVLDEAHTIKNRETKMSKAAMSLKAGFRLLLTGTPLQNHLSEIWNLFQFINPDMLGSFEHFNKRFIVPIEIDKSKSQQTELKKMLTPFLLRRTKNEVLDELPPKTEVVIPVHQTTEEEAYYEAMRRQALENMEDKNLTAVQTLAEITRLRQASSNIALVDPNHKGGSSKMKAFLELVDEILSNDHRALVFSQFTSHLALVRKELETRGIEYVYLDGSTPTATRARLVDCFQKGTMPLFLISLKAGGLGLNLTAADFIVHLDPWWNPAIEDQASDRAYRLGQTRPVTVYRLITSNTIEEKIIELHKTKKDLADSLLEGANMSHKLTRDEMLSLLGAK